MKSRYLKKRCIKGGKKRKPKSKNFYSDTNKDKYGKGDVCDSEKRIIVAAEIQLEKSFAKDRETETASEAGRRRGYD